MKYIKGEVTQLENYKHKNIVNFYSGFWKNGLLHIILEYCDGGDLYDYINKKR